MRPQRGTPSPSSSAEAPRDGETASWTQPRFAKDERLESLRELVRGEVSERGLLGAAYARLHVKAVGILLWAVASYWMLVVVTPWWWPVCLVSLVLAATGVAFNVMHDGNHQAFSRDGRLNRVGGLMLDLLGGSSFFWSQDHNRNHHGSPNVDPFDGDIQYGSLARVAPSQSWRPWFRFQHYYMWALYAFVPQRWQFYLDIRKLVAPGGPYQAPSARQRWVLLAGKATFVTWAFVIPALLHPWWCVLTVYLLGSALGGLLLATVLQWAHCVEGARFTEATPGEPRLEETWLEVQVEATRNVRLPRWLSWYVGGLDHQIEHHLFPRYPHTLYRRLAPSVERFCVANDLDYRAHRNVGLALRAHVRWLRTMGSPHPPVPSGVTAAVGPAIGAADR